MKRLLTQKYVQIVTEGKLFVLRDRLSPDNE